MYTIVEYFVLLLVHCCFFFSLYRQSFIGKMKFGVSKIFPNSLSKWLSPKVDETTARRRRHEEIDSDEDGGARDDSTSANVTDSRYQTTPQLAAPPPNKKKKTFTVSKTFLKYLI